MSYISYLKSAALLASLTCIACTGASSAAVLETKAVMAAPVAASLSPVEQKGLSFAVPSADGTIINGQIDFPAGYTPGQRIPIVVMVHGTGLFDRDAKFGKSGTDADKLFLEFSKKLTAQGLGVVRFDRRGVNYGKTGVDRINPAISGSTTVQTQWQDLQAVYEQALKTVKADAKCIAIFGHSEGMANIGLLATHDDRAPALVVGMGGLLESPKTVFKWQLSGRDAYSLRKMDTNGDGITTNAEVEANWMNTPSAVFNTKAPFIHPNGQWTGEDIKAVLEAQGAYYEQAKTTALAMDDAAPYPNAKRPMAQYSWWKHWYQDDTPVAQNLANWNSKFIFYNGDIDSQVVATRQKKAIEAHLKGRAVQKVMPGLGHSLGHHVLLGPMDNAAANALSHDITKTLNQTCR
jgi:Alpha/beta hydrolase family